MVKIERVNLSKQILSGLIEILKSGDYHVGDRIPTEKELSESMGVGRNSIREATKSLVLLGIIKAIPGKGTFLIKDPKVLNEDGTDALFNLKGVTLKELVSARKIIEVGAAELAAENVKKHPELARLIDEAENRISKDHFISWSGHIMDDPNSGFDLHKAIVEVSGNSIIKKMMESIYDELQAARALYPVTREEFSSEIDYHERIANAILSGDAIAAGRAMREHLENTEKVYERKGHLKESS